MNLTTPQPARHPNPTTRATGLAYVMFERPTLGDTAKFLTDFGLQFVSRRKDTMFFRGTDASPFCYVVRRGASSRFVGLGLRVASHADLVALKKACGANTVELCTWPGGGWRVRLQDPSGFRVDAIHGQQPIDESEHDSLLPIDAPTAAQPVDETHRSALCPPEVIKLGHVVLELANLQATCAWYTQHFGFIPSDVQVLPDGSPAIAFMRLDLGDKPTDHHTLAFAQGIAPAYHHSAFELADADAVGVGQRVLREHGWQHAWGMGRHTLGSQIFDFWEDRWGDKHKHYCGGDVFTAEVAMGVHAVSREAMSQWGEVMPASFTRPRLGISTLAALVRGLRQSPDLSVAKLRALNKVFG